MRSLVGGRRRDGRSMPVSTSVDGGVSGRGSASSCGAGSKSFAATRGPSSGSCTGRGDEATGGGGETDEAERNSRGDGEGGGRRMDDFGEPAGGVRVGVVWAGEADGDGGGKGFSPGGLAQSAEAGAASLVPPAPAPAAGRRAASCLLESWAGPPKIRWGPDGRPCRTWGPCASPDSTSREYSTGTRQCTRTRAAGARVGLLARIGPLGPRGHATRRLQVLIARISGSPSSETRATQDSDSGGTDGSVRRFRESTAAGRDELGQSLFFLWGCCCLSSRFVGLLNASPVRVARGYLGEVSRAVPASQGACQTSQTIDAAVPVPVPPGAGPFGAARFGAVRLVQSEPVKCLG